MNSGKGNTTQANNDYKQLEHLGINSLHNVIIVFNDFP